MDDNEMPEGPTVSAVRAAAENVLKLNEATQEKPMKLIDLIPQLEGALSNNGVPTISGLTQQQIYLVLKGASQDPLSKISSQRGRRGGYFLREQVAGEIASQPPSGATTSTQPAGAFLERHLWPAVEFWLKREKGIRNSSSSVANSKTGGVWSNPDVVGLLPRDDLGFFDVEIVTVEVKPSIVNWKYFIFEAVAHKRKSDRVYFLFRSKGEGVAEIAEMIRYAEKYRIGLVEFELSAVDEDDLKKWNDLSEAKNLTFSEYFVEHMPAPLDPIPIRDKIDFLHQLGISSKGEIYQFGLDT